MRLTIFPADLRNVFYISVILLTSLMLSSCKEGTWNNPYPEADRSANILYTSFSGRPKHLDPAQSYSSNEIAFTGQIYEPPLQYHFLKRPYQIIPLAAAKVPSAVYYDKDGNVLPENAPVKDIAFTFYNIQIKKNIKYQPHPALQKTKRVSRFI